MSLNEIDRILPKAPANTRIGILGGSFDPPHLSHQLLALSALAIEPIDMLWVIPCADHPFQKKMSAFEHRLNMCHLAFSRLNSDVHVVSIEKHLPAPNYTVHTLEAILKLRPGVKLFFTMGSDILEQMDKWHEPEKLASLSEVIIYLREGFPITNIPSQIKNLRIHDGYILPNIQSTHVRDFIKSNTASISTIPFVDQSVVRYIEKNELYR